VGFEPTRPEGHRLTGEPIPDMGPRVTQTARYQAPEPRPNEETFETTIFPFGKLIAELFCGNSVIDPRGAS